MLPLSTSCFSLALPYYLYFPSLSNSFSTCLLFLLNFCLSILISLSQFTSSSLPISLQSFLAFWCCLSSFSPFFIPFYLPSLQDSPSPFLLSLCLILSVFVFFFLLFLPWLPLVFFSLLFSSLIFLAQYLFFLFFVSLVFFLLFSSLFLCFSSSSFYW